MKTFDAPAMNNNYYASPLSQEEAQRRNQQLVGMNGMSMSGTDSIDEIIRQNTANELHRRRSQPQPFSPNMLQDPMDRRLSMSEFANVDQPYQDFQFGELASPQSATFGGLPTTMPGHSGPFQQSSMLVISDQSDFAPTLSPDIMGNMMAFSNLNVGPLGGNPASMGIYNSPMSQQYQQSPLDTVSPDYSMDMNIGGTPMSTSATLNNEDLVGVEDAFTPRAQQRPPNLTLNPNIAQFQQNSMPPPSRDMSGTLTYHSSSSRTLAQATPVVTVATTTTTPVTPATTTVGPALPENLQHKSDKSIYSKSGFDMLRALWYVATRKNPQLQIGAVDMSCAFVVCDVQQNDCPIMYVSDNFQNLTGYYRHEIMGQNCRFLQSPDGKVEAGTKREFVENDAVYRLKNAIQDGQEIQQSLINYRKGGKPFLNLLTMIPIPWDTDEIRYIIGFQIDLVECPDAISGHGDGGGMRVEYKHNDIGQYIWTPPNSSQWEPENGQTLAIDDVSTLLQQFNPKGAVSDWHKQSWDKMLLENADDVVHVLSLKGLFLYTSPSCKRLLEYDSTELIGHYLASICHPSDIVPVTRELKEAQANQPVNIVFRIRRKTSGYMWFESYGTLFSEQGKGRKCIVLVGRKRPIFALRRRDLDASGGIGDSEIWSKVSTSGMFLYVSSNVRSVLDLQREDLEGTSMQDLMRKESRLEFGRTVEMARRGKISSCKHEIQNKRGQVLQAHTTFYPGDTTDGSKPTFLLAQTKLLKASSRTIAPGHRTGGSGISAPPSVTSDDPHNVSPPAVGNEVAVIPHSANALPAPPSLELVLATDDNIFDELKTTRTTSWQYELRQMEKINKILAEELAQLLSAKKKRKRRKGTGNVVRDCANCHTRSTPEWRRGPSGQRDLCNSCGLRYAKQTGKVSPRNSSRGGNGDASSKKSNSPIHHSSLNREVSNGPGTTTTSKTMDTITSPGGLGTGSSSNSNSVSPPSGNDSEQATPAAGSTQNNNSSNEKASTITAGHVGPPQSQPLLEGGSGVGGGGMEMTSIREETEQQEPTAVKRGGNAGGA
ncbi:putative white collar 1 protein [Podospora fimiseda]|uniref:White collar 1 protein n=1 Tax=Podospora fimiseda TaxID=252190 RepID=A0AAN7H050_9PEZI|nr:putative white collar 1 protein [Podospora fimiseda]